MKKKIFTVIQVLVTVGILCWIFRDGKKDIEMKDKLCQARLIWIVAGIAAYGIVEILAAFRWQILLRVQGVQLGIWRVLNLLMIGILFNLFMPGGTGGDVIKIFYLFKEIPGKKAGALLA